MLRLFRAKLPHAALGLVCFLFIPVARAGPITLDKLVGGATIECGGLSFSGFQYDPGTGPDMAPADKITVDCVQIDNMVGLRFDGMWSNTATGRGRTDEARLTYIVTAQGGSYISAAMLTGDPAVTGGGDAEARVGEFLNALVNGCPD